jgi:hypothetical protein
MCLIVIISVRGYGTFQSHPAFLQRISLRRKHWHMNDSPPLTVKLRDMLLLPQNLLVVMTQWRSVCHCLASRKMVLQNPLITVDNGRRLLDVDATSLALDSLRY